MFHCKCHALGLVGCFDLAVAAPKGIEWRRSGVVFLLDSQSATLFSIAKMHQHARRLLGRYNCNCMTRRADGKFRRHETDEQSRNDTGIQSTLGCRLTEAGHPGAPRRKGLRPGRETLLSNVVERVFLHSNTLLPNGQTQGILKVVSSFDHSLQFTDQTRCFNTSLP